METFQVEIGGLNSTLAPTGPTVIKRDNITIPLAIYILEDEDEDLSSERTEEEVEQLFGRVNDIWRQADIKVDLVTLRKVTIPNDLLQRLTRSQWNNLWNEINRGRIDIARRTTPMWGFFIRSLGQNMNGLQPTNTRSFFVADTTTVLDYRTTAHEIGHLLHLYHDQTDRDHLMASATNGMVLSESEQTVARYIAEGMLEFG